jgi:hypothetical protein
LADANSPAIPGQLAHPALQLSAVVAGGMTMVC